MTSKPLLTVAIVGALCLFSSFLLLLSVDASQTDKIQAALAYVLMGVAGFLSGRLPSSSVEARK